MRVSLEWVIEDFSKSERQQSRWTMVLDLQKVPLQGPYRVPTGSALLFINVKSYLASLISSGGNASSLSTR